MEPPRKIQVVLAVLACLVAMAETFGKGAPGDVEKTREVVCESLMPLHFGSPLEPAQTNPFVLTASTPSCQQQEFSVKVQVESETEILLGFLMQARNEEDAIVGSFDPSYTPTTNLTCQGTSLTQSRRLKNKKVEMKWLPPCDLEGKVTIWALLMQNVTVFWKSSVEVTIAPQHKERCACVSEKGKFECAAGSAEWWMESAHNHFVLNSTTSSSHSYIAVGLSTDRTMGDDLVVYCYEDGGRLAVAGGRTVGKAFETVDLKGDDVQLKNGSLTSDHLSCHFSSPFTFVKSLPINLLNSKYFLFLAKGKHHKGSIDMHEEWCASQTPIDFSLALVAKQHARNITLLKLHGVLMVFAWMLVASVCLPLPRHFKHSPMPFSPCSKPFWFFWHQTGMITTSLLTCIAFVLIFIHVGGYSQASSWSGLHPLFGIFVTILTIANPLISLLRCAPTSPHRWIFNTVHQSVGLSAHAIAMSSLLLAGLTTRLAWWWKWVVLANCLWQVLVDFVLSGHTRLFSSRSVKDGDPESSSKKKPQVFKPCVFLAHLTVSIISTLICLIAVIQLQ